MLRITNTTDAGFALTGRLVDGWVDELARVLDATDPVQLRLDLRDVTFVDGRGVALLRALTGRGATLDNASGFVNALVWGDDDDRLQ